MLKKIIIFILIIFTSINIGVILKLDLFPSSYLLVFILGYLLLDLISILFLKMRNRLLFILGFLLTVCIIILSLILTLILFRSQIFFNSIVDNDSEFKKYSVVVLDESNYKKINDIENKKFGILKSYDSDYNKSLNDLKKNISLDYVNYENEYFLATALMNKEVEAILLNESYISILNEGINGFEDSIRILEILEIKLEKNSENKADYTDLSDKKSFNVYISGIDTYGEISSEARSDVNIIATVNLNTGKILLTNVPRDMYVHLSGTNGLNDKLTHAGIYGINTSVLTLEDFLDTEIDYYVRVNFSSLIKLVDNIGGIDVYSDYAFKAGNRYYQKGINYNLSGKEALAFSRNRYSFSDGDRQRGRNQEKVIAAIIDKLSSVYNINTYLEMLTILEDSFQTNMSKDDINKLINLQLKNKYNWNIDFSDVNGFDSMNYTYSYPWQMLYVMEVDYNSLENAKSKINGVLNNN